MIKIAQFGEGNFLRSFVDVYFNTLNKEGGEYEVNLICPIPSPLEEKFVEADYKYNVVTRGVKGGVAGVEHEKIEVVKGFFSPFNNPDGYYGLARDPELKLIVSNTTEAGIVFSEADKPESFPNISYPAKLTLFLYERFLAGEGGVHILPVELIDENGKELFSCVEKYVELWGMGEAFLDFCKNKCAFHSTLVDRIVSGFPKDEATQNELFALVGERDGLLSVCEPFGLWVIEGGRGIEKLIKDGTHNVEVIITDDISYYKKRKVRVLNGSHTNLVAAGLIEGKETVYDFMKDGALRAFFERCAEEEIIPFVSDDIPATEAFFRDVEARFDNPYLNHALVSISLNSISKWRARNLPTFSDYYEKHGKIAPCMTVGFSYLMALYSGVRRVGEGYESFGIKISDNREYLEYFADGGDIRAFMKDEKIFGEDLTKYEGFADEVVRNVSKIMAGESLIK